MEKDALGYLSESAKTDFGVLKKWTSSKSMSSQESFDNLKSLIGYKISKMLDQNLKQLLDLLYAADINETKVKACFDLDKSSTQIGLDLADLYLHRMSQKWKTRQEYSATLEDADWMDL